MASIPIQAVRSLRPVKNKGREKSNCFLIILSAQISQVCCSCINNKIQHIRAFRVLLSYVDMPCHNAYTQGHL